MHQPIRLLIVGGYGVFGGRLAYFLRAQAGLKLIIAGRSQSKAEAFCRQLDAHAALPVRFDRDSDLAEQLARLAPNLVVDAAGPFQAYGDNPYRLARAALDVGAHYLDLADATAFVTGISALDGLARVRGLFALSGVSTCPALSGAAMRALAQDMSAVDTIIGGIAPSPRADVGLSVMRAISGYAGRPVALKRDGVFTQAPAIVEARRKTIAPPGSTPLESRLFALVDVPDLQTAPAQWAGVKTVWFGAAPAPASLHRLFMLCARLVRWGLLPSLSPFAAFFYKARARLKWGEDRGGMFIEVTGEKDGVAIQREWSLIAEGDDGPFIPAMAAAAIIVKYLAGAKPAPGARDASTALDLQDFQSFFAQKAIVTGLTEHRPDVAPKNLYATVLGSAYAQLPYAIQTLHASTTLSARGRARVIRGQGILARATCFLFGFPAACDDIAVCVDFVRTGEDAKSCREVWTRAFGEKRFRSVQYAGAGRTDRLLMERFGPFSFGLALATDQQRLRLIVRNWRFLGVPLPRALAPAGETYEYQENETFHFHVEISHPWFGLIVRYIGWLAPG